MKKHIRKTISYYWDKLNNNRREAIHWENMFYLPVAKIVSQSGFGYGKNDWHPYVATIKEYISNSELAYEDSVLHEFYEAYSLKALEVTTGLELSKKLSLSYIAFYTALFRHPDYFSYYLKLSDQEFKKAYRNQYIKYNPQSGKKNYTTLLNLYKNIKKNGFDINLVDSNQLKDMFISGLIIKYNDDYRFLIYNGNHRVAVLSALSFNQVPVVLDNTKQVFDVDNIENWQIVKSGVCKQEDALYLIKRLFSIDGRDRAKMLGILS